MPPGVRPAASEEGNSAVLSPLPRCSSPVSSLPLETFCNPQSACLAPRLPSCPALPCISSANSSPPPALPLPSLGWALALGASFPESGPASCGPCPLVSSSLEREAPWDTRGCCVWFPSLLPTRSGRLSAVLWGQRGPIRLRALPPSSVLGTLIESGGHQRGSGGVTPVCWL